MSEIKAGDLVMVVRPTPCCGRSRELGLVFRITGILGADEVVCVSCNDMPGQDGLHGSARHEGAMRSQCIRIDPPAQPESIETDREVVA